MKSKLLKDKRISRYVILIFLIILIALELVTFVNRGTKPDNIEEKVAKEDTKMSLDDIIEDLNSKNINILSINKVEDGYYIIVEVKMKIKDYNEKINLLKKYNVESYEIEEKGDELTGSITINYW